MIDPKRTPPGIRALALAAAPAAGLLAVVSAAGPWVPRALGMAAFTAVYLVLPRDLRKLRAGEERRAAALILFTGLALRAVFWALAAPRIGHPSHLPEFPAGAWSFLSMSLAAGDPRQRLVTAALDILVQVLLVLLLRARGESPTAVFAYAWNPLVLLAVSRPESAGALAGCVALLLSLLSLHRGRRRLAVLVWGAGVLVHPLLVLLHAAFWTRLSSAEKRIHAAASTLALLVVVTAGGSVTGLESFNASLWSLAAFLGPAVAAAVAVALWLVLSWLVMRRRPPVMDGFATLLPTTLLVSPQAGTSWGPWLGLLFVFRPSLPWMALSGAMACALLHPEIPVWLRALEYGVLFLAGMAQAGWERRRRLPAQSRAIPV